MYNTVNIYAITDEKVKFGLETGWRKRTAKIRYNKDGVPFFKGFGGIKMMLDNFVRTDSAWGNKEAHAAGIVAQGTI